MKEWLEEEELDIEAMSEALLSLFDLIKKFEGCCDKDEEVSKNIQMIQFGHNRYARHRGNNLDDDLQAFHIQSEAFQACHHR